MNLSKTNDAPAADDLRAGVQAGILTEAQAASLTALIQSRAGQRAAMPSEDEPFEFFRGFSEIFISIGLVILMSGTLALLTLMGGSGVAFLLPLLAAGIAWWWAYYFTLKRRMNLPSMVLAVVFSFGIFAGAIIILSGPGAAPSRAMLLFPCAAAVFGLLLWYRVFRLPFAMFLLGGFALGAVYTLTATPESVARLYFGGFRGGVFDLRSNPAFAFSTLAFGVVAFIVAMRFDLRDPHRLGRNAATAFWLHLLAAPALVNTVAMTLYNTGGSHGMALLALALVAISALALVIDRRSFLTAAIAYIALIISWVIDGNFGSWALTLLILGALITAIGTWWVQLRAWLMRVLPDFPGKDRLPPYSRAE